MTHTPEPWQIHKTNPELIIWNGQIIATFGHPVLETEQGVNNAKRAVACINACVGIPTDDLTPELAYKAVKALSDCDNERNQLLQLLEAALNQLEKVTDALREAMYLTDDEGGDYTDEYGPIVEQATAIIETAKNLRMNDKKFIQACQKQGHQISLTPLPGVDIKKCVIAAQEIANKTGKPVTVNHTQGAKTVYPN